MLMVKKLFKRFMKKNCKKKNKKEFRTEKLKVINYMSNGKVDEHFNSLIDKKDIVIQNELFLRIICAH